MTQPVPRRVRRLPGARVWVALLLGLVTLASALDPQGEALLEVEAPAPGAVVPPGGVEVIVRFRGGGWVAPETFRALVNGADVTAALTVGENGAYGRVHGLRDGENVLRFEVFGRSWWSRDSLVQGSREVHLRLRRRLDLYRG